jgi:hypothetical protein
MADNNKSSGQESEFSVENRVLQRNSAHFFQMMRENAQKDPDGKNFEEQSKIRHEPGYHAGDDEKSQHLGVPIIVPPEMPGEKQPKPVWEEGKPLAPIYDDIPPNQEPHHGLSIGKISPQMRAR